MLASLDLLFSCPTEDPELRDAIVDAALVPMQILGQVASYLPRLPATDDDDGPRAGMTFTVSRALEHVSIGFAASGEPDTTPTDPLPVRGGPLVVTPLKNGPLGVRGPLEVITGTGRTVRRMNGAKLCRCGGSANKPFCDGAHARIGFQADGAG